MQGICHIIILSTSKWSFQIEFYDNDQSSDKRQGVSFKLWLLVSATFLIFLFLKFLGNLSKHYFSLLLFEHTFIEDAFNIKNHNTYGALFLVQSSFLIHFQHGTWQALLRDLSDQGSKRGWILTICIHYPDIDVVSKNH